MSRLPLSTRDIRAVALGVGVIGGLLLWFRGLPAWREWARGVEAAAAEREAAVEQVEALLAGFPAGSDSLAARRRRLVDLVTVESASALTTLLAEAARLTSVRLDATQARSVAGDSVNLPRVAVDAELVGDIAGLASLVRLLETRPELLSLKRLSVRPQGVDGPHDQPETLTIVLTLEAAVVGQTGHE